MFHSALVLQLYYGNISKLIGFESSARTDLLRVNNIYTGRCAPPPRPSQLSC
jgi:hypothetical protein